MDSYVYELRRKIGHDLIVCPTASLAALDDKGDLLLIRRLDDAKWGLPGGLMTPGESVEECALREFVEETGWSASLDGLFGIYSRPSEQTHTYPNGDRVQFVTVVFQGKVGNRMGIGDGEATELDFFSRPPTYNQLTPTDLPIIRDYFLKKPHPVVR